MTDDTDVPPVSSLAPMPKQMEGHEPNHDEKVRVFLACCAVIFVFLAFGAYLITRDIAILLGNTITGIAVLSVFRYYFSRKK